MKLNVLLALCFMSVSSSAWEDPQWGQAQNFALQIFRTTPAVRQQRDGVRALLTQRASGSVFEGRPAATVLNRECSEHSCSYRILVTQGLSHDSQNKIESVLAYVEVSMSRTGRLAGGQVVRVANSTTLRRVWPER